MKLPTLSIASTTAPAENLRALGERLFPREDHAVAERGAQLELQSRSGSIEVDIAKGGVWGADLSRLWRFDPRGPAKRSLMGKEEARAAGMEVLTRYGVIPELRSPFHLGETKVTGTMTSFVSTEDAERRTIQEDTTVLVNVEVDVSDIGVETKTLPIVGGGGRFGVVFGEGGRMLAARGVWRPVIGKPELHEVIPQDKADETYRAITSGANLKRFSSKLAYYATPAFSEQDQLYPVYVYSGVAEYGGQVVPLRKIIVPATDVGPSDAKSQPQPLRKSTARPRIRPLPADFKPAPGKTLPPGIVVNRRLLGKKFNDIFEIAHPGASLVIKPGLSLDLLKELQNALGFYSAGTSWIGESGGLGGSKNNAQGFVNELSAGGWNIRFNWGDANAWESDWRKNDDAWVDAVDFVFYTGHANSDGWVLSKPDDTFLHFSETAGSRDLWGAKNLEWAVIAACGPLQDEVVGSGGDVLDRWRNAFDGLHILMGYAQVTYDNEEEGKRVAMYARRGATIIQSWFRTAQEIQSPAPPDAIWAGAYYLGDSRGSTANDHLWGVGSVGPDITNPTWRACTWVPC